LSADQDFRRRQTKKFSRSLPSFVLLAAAISLAAGIAIKKNLCPNRSTVTAGKVCATGAVQASG